eukprot:6055021-Pyramimonas_sp.AAC.1
MVGGPAARSTPRRALVTLDGPGLHALGLAALGAQLAARLGRGPPAVGLSAACEKPHLGEVVAQ